MDAYKQAAINLFLGHCQPHQGKSAPWEPESVAGENVLDDNTSKLMKRAKSDGSILRKSNTSMSSNGQNGISTSEFSGLKKDLQSPNCQSDTVHVVSRTSDNAVLKSSYTPTVSHIKYASCELGYCSGSGDSNFLNLDWLSASENGRTRAGSTPDVNVPTNNGGSGHVPEIQARGLSENFMQWVDEGEVFWY